MYICGMYGKDISVSHCEPSDPSGVQPVAAERRSYKFTALPANSVFSFSIAAGRFRAYSTSRKNERARRSEKRSHNAGDRGIRFHAVCVYGKTEEGSYRGIAADVYRELKGIKEDGRSLSRS